jgi:hypothetical protein
LPDAVIFKTDFKGGYLIMKKNMGVNDRIIRICIACLVAILYLMDFISGLAAAILGIMAVIFIITSVMGFCPLYVILGIDTRSRKSS